MTDKEAWDRNAGLAKLCIRDIPMTENDIRRIEKHFKQLLDLHSERIPIAPPSEKAHEPLAETLLHFGR